MRWASTATTASRLEDAVAEAMDSLAADLGGAADVVFAFASADYADHIARLPGCVAESMPAARVFGCTAGGVLGGGREIEDGPALAMAAARLPGVTIEPLRFGPGPRGWSRALASATDADVVLLLPDPLTCAPGALVNAANRALPGTPIVGGLASGSDQLGATALFGGGRVHRTGAVGLALSGNLEVETVVAQGCRPIGTPLFVTRCEGQALIELDGEPALDVLDALQAELPPSDQELARHALLLGLVMEPDREVYRQGDFLARNVIGVDPDLGALAVDAELTLGQVVQFHLRDADTSADDLDQLLARHRGGPAGALLFSCLGRGQGLYGRPDHDSELFRHHLGPAPLAGFFSSGEIGPVGASTYLHGYTSAFALFRPGGG